MGMHPLIGVARNSIRHGFGAGQALPIDPSDFPEELRELKATFVSLKRYGSLRGCMGTLEAFRPLVEDVAQNAFVAGFRDPRFRPVRRMDFNHLEVHISVLSKLERVRVGSEQELLEVIQPRNDGLLLRAGQHQGTFLPSVWETLQSPKLFLAELRKKAGLPHDYWSEALEVYRYTAEEIHYAPAARIPSPI